MSVRYTSIEAYHSILESGEIGKQQKQVYSALYNAGPSTARELFGKLGKSKLVNNGNIHTRIAELRDRGLVIELDTTVCKYSGKLVTVYATTDTHVPLPRIIKPTKKMRREKALKQLEKLPNCSRYELVNETMILEKLILEI